jgi:hypothetical protein
MSITSFPFPGLGADRRSRQTSRPFAESAIGKREIRTRPISGHGPRRRPIQLACFASRRLSRSPSRKMVPYLRFRTRIQSPPAICWSSPFKRADNHIGEVHRCVVKRCGWFSGAPAVAAEDFNSKVQWYANRLGQNHTEVVRLFESHGLIS